MCLKESYVYESIIKFSIYQLVKKRGGEMMVLIKV